jgi:tRNA dimethylallyltransferase
MGVTMAAGPQIYAVIGPTASGKSDLAHALARRLGGEILCVDSMSVYRGMDVGTAKPTPAERAEVPYHLLDVAEPTEAFVVSRFVTLADAAIADAAARGVPALVAVGGTPMYFKALFEGLFEGPGADDAIRTRLEAEPTEALHARVNAIDPAAGHRINWNDRRRLIRALEVYELTGKPITDHQQEWGRQVRIPARWIGLRWEREALNRRINLRVRKMFDADWLDEVRGLVARHGTLSKTAAEATGYGELLDHLAGRLSFDEAYELTKVRTRQLASRQTKWFRRFPDVTWFDGEHFSEGTLGTYVAMAGTP